MNSFFLSEGTKLKNIQIFLEKNDNLSNYLSKYGDECDLSNYFLQTEKSRKAEFDQITNELKEIWTSLEIKKKVLREDINNLDLKSFKKDLITIQDKMYDMRIQFNMNIETLKDQEKDCSEILNLYNQKVEDWDKPVKPIGNINYCLKSSIIPSHCNDSKEVKEFMDFINKSKGYENGWSTNDHQLFIKLRKKNKDPETLASNLNKLLPDISRERIKDHEIWYRKYLQLKVKKDAALEKWRQSKNEITYEKNDENNDINISTRISNVVKFTDKSIHEKIAEWRAEKEARGQQKLITEQQRRAKLKQKQDERRQLHEEVKQSVAKWKEAKLIKEKKQKIEREFVEHQEKKIKAAEANKLIKQFQSQDDIFIMKMRYNRLPQKQEIRRTKSSYMVNRDPQRLLRPTKQWLVRISKDNFMESQGSTSVPNIRTIPKLRMPEWRKNCNN